MTEQAKDWSMGLPPIILASASPRRRELLCQMGLTFEVRPSHAQELHEEHLTAREVSQLNAYRKAREIAKSNPDALVLGADTLVYLGTQLFGKPANLDEAMAMLEQLQGQTHEVVTAICLLHLREHRQKLFAESTAVTFHRLNTDQMRAYFTKVSPLDKAGAYAIQEDGHLIVEKIDGSYSNVVGLPVERLEEELRLWGQE
jgi:septum formation protein